MTASLKDETIGHLVAEVTAARKKFPSPKGLSAALVEEVAEWADQATMIPLAHYDWNQERKELLQVACVAMRLYEEGDPLRKAPSTFNLLASLCRFEDRARAALFELCGKKAAEKSTR